MDREQKEDGTLAGDDRLERQIRFIVEADKLKSVYRRTLLMNGSRYENDAEHSWHLAMLVILFSEYANEQDMDLFKVMKMVIVHDLVEIDAGDTFCYDDDGATTKAERERVAAERVFGILPPDQGRVMRDLWEEFERRETPEAKFAAALDRLQPMLHNYNTRGAAWRENGVVRDKVVSRNRHMAEGSETLWAFATRLIEDSVRKGYLPVKQVKQATVR